MSFQTRFEEPNYSEILAVDPDEIHQIIHLNRKDGNCLVKKGNGKSFVCTLAHWLKESICVYDYVEVKKSPVTGEWVVTDYSVNEEIAGAIHNSYQDCYDDMVCDEDGVPYGY